MRINALMFAAAGALFLGGLPASAGAAPAGPLQMLVSGSELSRIGYVHYRRCWNCRPYVPPYFYRGYPGPYDPYYYGPLYGYGPGYYGFYYGGDARVHRRGRGRW